MSITLKDPKILIVEDFDAMREMINSVLTMGGFTKTNRVANGWEAKRYLDQATPNLIISGWDMPRASGIKLLKAVSKNQRLKSVPFIMLTTRADKDSVVEAIKEGVDAYMLKPFRFGTLLDKVNELLDGSYVQPAIEERMNNIVSHIEEKSLVPNFTAVPEEVEAFKEQINTFTETSKESGAEEEVPVAKTVIDKESLQTVLIVDDTPSNVDVIAGVLKNQFKTRVAINGEQALNLVSKHKPDIILLDIMMPGIDGFEVCSKLKENAGTKDIPVIFVSAKSDAVDIKKGFDLGAVDYITKPVNPDVLLAKVEVHIGLAESLKNK